MNTSTISDAREQAKTGFFEVAEKVSDLSNNVKERCKDAYRDAERGVRRMKIAAESGIDETRQQIKSRPLMAMAVVASGAFVAGVIAGFFGARSARR
jgi:ElaB/YqjD/DUF883 family membrane-anchored ribosome-binding protein